MEEEKITINPNMTRVNIRITKELHQLYKAESEKTGISMSILMYKDLEQAKIQRSVIDALPAMLEVIEQFKSLNGEERLSEAVLDMEGE